MDKILDHVSVLQTAKNMEEVADLVHKCTQEKILLHFPAESPEEKILANL